MIKINFINKTDQSVSSKHVVTSVKKTILDHVKMTNVELTVSVVEHNTVVELAEKYLDEQGETAQDHPVLSFVESEIEKDFVTMPCKYQYLGDIVVSINKAKKQSVEQKISINQAVSDLACHGALHLVGIHHD